MSRSILDKMKDVLSTHTIQMEQLVEREKENEVLIQNIQQAFNELKFEMTNKLPIQKENIAESELNKKITCELLKNNSPTKMLEMELEINKLKNECKDLRMLIERNSHPINPKVLRNGSEEEYVLKSVGDMKKELFKVSTDLAIESKRIQRLEDQMTIQRSELLGRLSEIEKYVTYPSRSYLHQFEYKPI